MRIIHLTFALMRHLPPRAQLRAFEAAARHTSFKSAAAELGVTPTAISHQIRALEAFCGRSLFRRRPRPLALTEAGARLFPVVRDGLDGFAATVRAIRTDTEQQPLKVTTTNAFASRWLVPRLPDWRREHPEIALEVMGTPAVVDLRSGEADVALRYMASAPDGLIAHELLRDRFVLLASPRLLPGGAGGPGLDLARQTVVESVWSSPYAPTWQRWLSLARKSDPDFPEIRGGRLRFDEELNAIDALVSGQGIGICSDALVARELESGALVQIAEFAMPGLGLYCAYLPDHPRRSDIETFLSWARTLA